MLKTYFDPALTEAGCDEAGRGCLAGPVFAASVIWPRNLENEQIRDSKKMSSKQREKLKTFIEKNALAFSVSQVDHEIIDDINILQSSIKAMHLALDKINIDFDLILVDGNRFNNYKDKTHKTIIRGDDAYLSIAAASILAKTYRDSYMSELHKIHPQYNWDKNKGYPTKEHIEHIKKYGLTEYHRKSFCTKIVKRFLFSS